MLNPDHPDMRFYGAQRFDKSAEQGCNATDANWEPYRGYTFVLPSLELYFDGQLKRHYLAANVSCSESVSKLCQIISQISPPSRYSFPALVPPSAYVEELTTFEHWDAAMTEILKALHAKQYDKIVLARRKRFHFNAETVPDVLSVVRMLQAPAAMEGPKNCTKLLNGAGDGNVRIIGNNIRNPEILIEDEVTDNVCIAPCASRGTYTFCLQLDKGTAFLGCSPERLFRRENSIVLTQALAGTVRQSDAEHDDSATSELCNEKNMEEHKFVVDFVSAALRNVGFAVDTRGPNILRLPRLMHLATDITGQYSESALDEEGTDDASPDLTHRLLTALHPTPAVCGMPRAGTLSKLPELEGFDRGFFAGPLGWFSINASDFCVAIRSALVTGNYVTAYAGSGIVTRSESRSEWDETELKMSAFNDIFCAKDEQSRCCTEPNLNGHIKESTDDILQNGFGNGILKDQQVFQAVGTLDAASSNCIEIINDGNEYFDCRCMENEPNLNTLWGSVAVEELCRCGINLFIVCPGSRSAPLAVAVVRSRRARYVVSHDERGAGFLAVGYARATGRPAAVITSSGTAVANLLPSLAEAFNDKVPIIVMTADRPPELRDVGANQVIDQTKIFGAYVRWMKDMPCPTDQILLRNLLVDIDYAAHMSGIGYGFCYTDEHCNRGPVHLNFCFREHLAPEVEFWRRSCLRGISENWKAGIQPFTTYGSVCSEGRRTAQECMVCSKEVANFGNLECLKPHGRHSFAPHRETIRHCTWSRLRESSRVLIVVGGGVGGGQDIAEKFAILRVAEYFDWPILPDVASGLRFEGSSETVIHYADLVLNVAHDYVAQKFDVVLQFGERITSKRISAITCAIAEYGMYVIVSPSSNRIDVNSSVTFRYTGSAMSFMQRILDSEKACDGYDDAVRFAFAGHIHNHKRLSPGSDASHVKSPLRDLQMLSKEIEAYLSSLIKSAAETSLIYEPLVAHAVIRSLPESSCVFIGNSMPIRDLDVFGPPRPNSRLEFHANRGASGIDGVLSSGIGLAIGCNRPVYIILGDMSALHDLNGLHLLRPASDGGLLCPPVTVMVINNGGSGIFSMLPIARYRTVFTPVFDTPHNVRFESIAIAFGVQYTSVSTLDGLASILADSPQSHRLIEIAIRADHSNSARHRRKLIADLSQHLRKFANRNEMLLD